MELEDIQEIKQEEISLDKMEMEGGDFIPNIEPEFIVNPTRYKVISGKGMKTQWGTRVDYIIESISLESQQYKLSSWNFVTKDKFKPIDLIGKNIELTKYVKKKCILKVL